LTTPVFSPILGRYYNDADVLGECLAEHLVRPVDFAGAVRHAYGEGVRRFVECGALETLSKLTAKALANQDITTIPTLKTAKDESTTLRDAIAKVNGTSPLAMPETVDARMLLMPGNSKEEIDTFWAARGRGILDYVHSEFTAFKATAGKASVSKPSAGKPMESCSVSTGIRAKTSPADPAARLRL
jgi:acyl transferase domain-containing protein